MNKNGYSLIEVLIASAILLIGITAAALLASALYTQEIQDAKIAQAINAQTQAAALWQLGLSPTTITNILPAKCSNSAPPADGSIYLSFNATTNTTIGGSNGPVMDKLEPLQIVFPSASAPDGTPVYRTNNITVFRPSIR